ncbi:MAG: amidophosphoribosyltransferase [Nitrososphaerota archaeon]|nr:amidophosphoribosyltransferase [Candidatus Bathyarchaeota archaeon]MDW8049174.1 amidophosphoribosyltransferase [Nitrososphaerota archaeon]
MPCSLEEKCGVIGFFSFNDYNVTPLLIGGLEALQHRGQESWGISVAGNPTFKRLGTVSQSVEIEHEKIFRIRGNAGIGHVRYSTTARSTIEHAHPIDIGNTTDEHIFHIAHNGTIERDLLAENFGYLGAQFPHGMTDTELMGLSLHKFLERGKSWVEAFEELSPCLNGSFSLVILTSKGELIGVRDEMGFRPLCLGWHEESSSYIIVSESCALEAIGAKLVRDIEPGEIVIVDRDGLRSEYFARVGRHAHCPFEYTYFAHPSSKIEGITVYNARKNIGRILAKNYQIEGDVVVPVPDSARPAALGYSEETGIPFDEGLLKDRYRHKGGWRSFIEPDGREEIVSNIVAVRDVVKNKKVILIDDSIVRGTSSRIIIRNKLRDASKVSLLLTFPPIIYPCYMGIDFPSQEELLAYRLRGTCMSLEEINRTVAEHIGASFVGYNNVEGLSKGIGLPKDELCLACITGDYSCLKRKPKFKTREEMRG